jgi:hypothetical protein
MGRVPEIYDYLCSIGDLIDKLSIENIKCFDANMKAIAERKKDKPSAALLAKCEGQARTAGEQRVRLKDEINHRLAEALERGRIQCAPEARTYDPEDRG